MTCFPSIALIQFGKFQLSMNPSAILDQSVVVEGDLMQSWRASHIAGQVSRRMLDSVDLPTLDAKDWDCWESPVARYQRVTMSLSAGAKGFLERHGFFSMKGSTSASKCENQSLKTSRHCLSSSELYSFS